MKKLNKVNASQEEKDSTQMQSTQLKAVKSDRPVTAEELQKFKAQNAAKEEK